MAEELKNTKPRTGAVKTTQTCHEAGQLIKKFNADAVRALQEGSPVAWVMVSSMMEELCAAMDISPVFTENYATAAASRPGGVKMLEVHLNSNPKKEIARLSPGDLQLRPRGHRPRHATAAVRLRPARLAAGRNGGPHRDPGLHQRV